MDIQKIWGQGARIMENQMQTSFMPSQTKSVKIETVCLSPAYYAMFDEWSYIPASDNDNGIRCVGDRLPGAPYQAASCPIDLVEGLGIRLLDLADLDACVIIELHCKDKEIIELCGPFPIDSAVALWRKLAAVLQVPLMLCENTGATHKVVNKIGPVIAKKPQKRRYQSRTSRYPHLALRQACSFSIGQSA
jgi:hypothetical protein